MSGQSKWWVRNRSLVDVSAEPEPAPDLESLTKADLVALAEEKGVDSAGTKADIIERLSDE